MHDTFDSANYHENKPGNIHSKKWWFLDDRPILRDSDDAIWGNGDGDILTQIADIAEQVTAPLGDRAGSVAGMTFGIFGDWGAGKSSFLRMLQAKISELATRKEQQDSVVFSTYVASAYPYHGVSVRHTLALQLIRGLEASGHSICTHLLEQVAGSQISKFAESLGQMADVDKAATALMTLKELPMLLSEVFSGKTEVTKQRSRVVVCFVDDLDRCPSEVVKNVLQTTQEWADVRNLFFVLAINREWLIKAIQNLVHIADEPDYALEKYLQHSITLGNLEGDGLVSYVKSLLGRYDDEISRHIMENVVQLQKGLTHATPRAVKRLLNAIRPKLVTKLQREKNQFNDEEIRRVIKAEVLAYCWPKFHQDYYRPSVLGKHQGLAKRWSQLEAICRTYEQEAEIDRTDPDKEKLEFSVRRLRETSRDEQFMNPVDYRLVSFLAEPPYWLYAPPKSSDSLDPGQSIPPKQSSFSFEKADLISPRGVDLDSEFMQLYYSGQGEDDGTRKLEYYREAAELASKHFTQMSPERANEVGNMAMDAERLHVPPFADKLFQFALDLDPNHPNNMQNYVSFILDTKRVASYPRAQELLEELKKKYTNFKPERTQLFTLQLNEVNGQQTILTGDEIEKIRMKVTNAPTDLMSFGNATRLAVKTGNFDLAKEILQIACDPAHSPTPAYLYQRLRSFADSIAAQRESPDERLQSMEIYRRLLTHKANFSFSSSDEAEIRHNYATLLFAFDYDDEAGREWYEAYRLMPSDFAIRGAYSQYIRQAERLDVAVKIMAGQALTESEKILWPKIKPIPERFSDQAYLDTLFGQL
ncbi:P-loop NTPase fold protein [Accumulibacter sp.]|uniref:P-loop NTPase fold protein n=1 Tax=Accumulibacter sp. TaxID=2053492 RepID=UPI002628CACF|nr:P-loop NTPase fold protein [Accumulibacter sp.]